MSLLRLALAKFRAVFRRNVVADEIRDEMRFHLEKREAEYQQQGLTPEDARRRARKQFGNLAVMQDRGYDVRGGGVLETVAQDVRYGARVLGRQPIVIAAVVLTLALAVAANTALFSIFDGLLFRPLPYKNPDAIVRIDLPDGLSRGEFVAMQNDLLATPMLREPVGTTRGGLFEEGAQATAEWGLAPAIVTPSFFDLFGVRPLYGRALSNEDRGGTFGGPRPLILGYDLWQARFGGDPGIINRVIEIPGTVLRNSWIVVGIMPQGFDFPSGSNLWAPASPYPQPPKFARLAHDVTIEMLRGQFPTVTFTPLREYLRPRGAMAFAFLLGATGLLLVVAWVQIAALLFSRAIARGREIGVRLALGASSGRLIRQFGTEAMLIVGAALALGWLMARPLTAFVVRLLPAEITVGQMLEPDLRTLLFTCALSAAGVLLLTLLPAGLVHRTSTTDLLRSGTAVGARTSVTRVRALLTTMQIAVTASLLYMAGLAVHSFSTVSAVPLGFDASRLVAVRLPVITVMSKVLEPGTAPVADQQDLNRQMQLQFEVVDAIRSVPGVLHATSVDRYPLQTGPASTQTLTSRTAGSNVQIDAQVMDVAAGFAATLGLPVLEGRDATPDDFGDRLGIVHHAESTTVTTAHVMTASRVALVNQTIARILEPAGTVPGQIITMRGNDYRILGVVGDFVSERPDLPRQPQVFIPTKITSFVIARLSPDAPDAEAGIRATLDRLWADRASRQIIRLEDEYARATGDYRARSILLTLLGVLSLPLAIIGLVAAQMDAVRQQTRYIAIRLALGAEPADVRRRVVWRTAAIITIGLTAGLGAGVGVGRLMASYLYGVEALDAISIALVAALLLSVGLLAALWPANRASRVAPALVLRDL